MHVRVGIDRLEIYYIMFYVIIDVKNFVLQLVLLLLFRVKCYNLYKVLLCVN